MARGTGECGGQAQPRDRRQDGVRQLDEARKRVLFKEVGERRAAEYRADPHAHELEQATWARMSGWDEARLREEFGEVLTEESDFEMLMAIRPDVRDLDNDLVEPENYEYIAALYRRERGFDEARLRAMFGDNLTEEQYAEALAVKPDPRVNPDTGHWWGFDADGNKI
jgi:hypothetical protein